MNRHRHFQKPGVAAVMMTITLMAFAVLVLPAEAPARGPLTPPGPHFTDVPEGSPYEHAINFLAQADIISGYSDGTFRPEKPVMRAQFAKMIVGSLPNIRASEDIRSPFTDFGVPDSPTDLYPHDYVAVAWQRGITKGTSSTTYSPWANISRAQVVTMVVRALEAEHPGFLHEPSASYTSTWGTGFSAEHGENARIAEATGLLSGLPLATEASDPWAMMPRGEVAQVLANMIGNWMGG